MAPNTEPLVARILLATAVVANPAQAIHSNESKSKHAIDRNGISTGTSSKGDTVGDRPSGEGGINVDAKAGVCSSVQALNQEALVEVSTGATTEYSPIEEFDGEEEVFKRAKDRVNGRVAQDNNIKGATNKRKMPAVGRRIRVFWEGENAWFDGVAEHLDEKNGLVYVVYDDGDEAWEALGPGGKTAWEHVIDGRVENLAQDIHDRGHRGANENDDSRNNARDVPRTTSKPVTILADEVAAPVKLKRKALAGVNEDVRGRMGASPGKGEGATRKSVPSVPARKHRRLQALIGDHRTYNAVRSPQPGNVTNHSRRALRSAKNTPDSGAGAGVVTKKGTVSKTAMAKRTTQPKEAMEKATVSKKTPRKPKNAQSSALKPTFIQATPAQPNLKPPLCTGVPPSTDQRKKNLTLGDTHDLSSNPSDEEDDELDVNVPKQPGITMTARDMGDEADIFALNALNDAISKAVDSQTTLANKISTQKLSLLKLEMKHALEEAHNKSKNKLAEVTHVSRVNCTNAINTLSSKISEMDIFIQQQQATFNSMQRQCQTLRNTAEQTITSSEKRIASLHQTEMVSLQKLHNMLYTKYTDGVAYIRNYSERMNNAGGKLIKGLN